MASKVIESVKKIIDDAAIKYQLELVDIEFVTENDSKYLRVYLYKKDGVTMEDCTLVHKEINLTIDDVMIYEDEYFLEVSSPGYDRALNKEDLKRYEGSLINVKLYAPIDGVKTFEGRLISFDGKSITILVEDEEKIIEVSKTSKIKRIFEQK